MNFYETVMRFLFENAEFVSDKKFIGKTMIGKLDDNKLVKFQFVSTVVQNSYNAINVSIINKDEGLVDEQTIKFSDVIGMHDPGNDFEPVEPQMLEYRGKTRWSTDLDGLEMRRIANTVIGYVELFRCDAKSLERNNNKPELDAVIMGAADKVNKSCSFKSNDRNLEI